jgi:hypothetical protein
MEWGKGIGTRSEPLFGYRHLQLTHNVTRRLLSWRAQKFWLFLLTLLTATEALQWIVDDTANLPSPDHTVSHRNRKRTAAGPALLCTFGLYSKQSKYLQHFCKLCSDLCCRHKSVSLRRETLQRKSYWCTPRKETARPQSQFSHSCICERFIYILPQSVHPLYFPAAQ